MASRFAGLSTKHVRAGRERRPLRPSFRRTAARSGGRSGLPWPLGVSLTVGAQSKTNWADKGSAKKRDAVWYLNKIDSHPLMYYHRRKVAMVCEDNGDDVYWIGYVRNVKAPKAKAGSVAYVICFPDNPGAEDEQWSPAELANGLSLADELGSAGTWGAQG